MARARTDITISPDTDQGIYFVSGRLACSSTILEDHSWLVTFHASEYLTVRLMWRFAIFWHPKHLSKEHSLIATDNLPSNGFRIKHVMFFRSPNCQCLICLFRFPFVQIVTRPTTDHQPEPSALRRARNFFAAGNAAGAHICRVQGSSGFWHVRCKTLHLSTYAPLRVYIFVCFIFNLMMLIFGYLEGLRHCLFANIWVSSILSSESCYANVSNQFTIQACWSRYALW